MAIWVKPSGMEIEINDQDGNLKAAVSLGWKLKEDIKNDGEKGSGEPGTADWHKSAVKGCANADEVGDYMQSIGIEMNATGHLKTVKSNACKLIDEVFK